MNDKLHLIGHQSARGPDLNREEIRGGYHLPVRLQESRPRSAFFSVRRRFDAMPFQYVLDRVRCNDVPKIGECALDSVVALGVIFPRHADDQIGDLLGDARSAWSLPGKGPLLDNKLTVPGEQSIGRDERLEFIE